MDRIIDIFVIRKNRESFMRSVHVLIILLYIGLKSLNCVFILYKRDCLGFYVLLRCDRMMIKKYYFKNLC